MPQPHKFYSHSTNPLPQGLYYYYSPHQVTCDVLNTPLCLSWWPPVSPYHRRWSIQVVSAKAAPQHPSISEHNNPRSNKLSELLFVSPRVRSDTGKCCRIHFLYSYR